MLHIMAMAILWKYKSSGLALSMFFCWTLDKFGTTQDTIYYKWASVKMTVKFHFLRVYQLYILIG